MCYTMEALKRIGRHYEQCHVSALYKGLSMTVIIAVAFENKNANQSYYKI